MRYIAIFLFMIVFTGFVQAADFSVGTSPSVVEVGDVSPGEQKVVGFSIFTVSSDPLLVNFEVESGNMDFFNKGYKNLIFNFSEEPTNTWIDLLNNPVEINTSGDRASGRSWKDINVLLKVPKNAEPGYHVINIKPMPSVYGGGTTPVGTSIVSVTMVSILFNVRGNARREGLILDSTGLGYNEKDFDIKTFFQNTGTDTLYSRCKNTVYDKNNSLIGEFSSPRTYVKPGTVATLQTPVGGLREGDYTVNSVVSFTTGDAQKNTTIHVYGQAPLTEAPPHIEGIPWLIIFLIIIIIAIVYGLYRWLHGSRA